MGKKIDIKKENIEIEIEQDTGFSTTTNGAVIIKFKDIGIGIVLTKSQLLAARRQLDYREFIRAEIFKLESE